MKMRHAMYVLALMLLVVVVSACGSSPTPTPAPKPTAPPPTAPPPTEVPPSPAPTATLVPPTPVPPTATPVPLMATAKQQVNVRQGPGTQFSVTSRMPKDASAVVLGKSEDGKWYQLAYPDAQHPSWVAIAFVNVTGDTGTLPVVAVVPPPTLTPGAVAVATKAPAATPTQAVPPAKGVISFVSWDVTGASYVLANAVLNPRNIGGFRLMGTAPFDLSQSTNAAPFAWAPDTSGRVVWVYGPTGTKNVLRLTDSGGDRDLVSHQGISSPSWSPDAKSVAYVGIDNGFGTQFIYTMGPDLHENRLFGARQNKPESFRGVAWGKNYFLFVSNYTGYDEIWRLNSDGTGPVQLTNDRRENGAPAWSRDGTHFAYYSKQLDGSYQIMVANADGTGVRKLTNAGNNFTPTWSPDGNWIAFTSDRGGRLDIYIMDKNGGNVQPVTDKYLLGCAAPQCRNQLPGSWR